jgi:hypothetical protein
MNANENIFEISKREIELYSYPPPGSNKVVTSR